MIISALASGMRMTLSINWNYFLKSGVKVGYNQRYYKDGNCVAFSKYISPPLTIVKRPIGELVWRQQKYYSLRNVKNTMYVPI
jgi:hypothetical protein